MAFREVSTTKVFINYRDHQDGDVLCEGRFVGVRGGKFGDNYEVDDGGQLYSLSSAAQLAKIFGGRVQQGDWVKVTYRGKKEIKGGKTAHGFKVEVDADKRGATVAPVNGVGF